MMDESERKFLVRESEESLPCSNVLYVLKLITIFVGFLYLLYSIVERRSQVANISSTQVKNYRCYVMRQTLLSVMSVKNYFEFWWLAYYLFHLNSSHHHLFLSDCKHLAML
ncbi:hypothetical protein PR048_027857 [Dryococelus australis]|uniref:Uncharacterized protein n=1 Tax=Dryococelus australis TaxID=614101 RepID=A0ABQ9GHP3_9NEOP|nr:hypothetical protein PR048_027857 [Dryococelus australis]